MSHSGEPTPGKSPTEATAEIILTAALDTAEALGDENLRKNLQTFADSVGSDVAHERVAAQLCEEFEGAWDMVAKRIKELMIERQSAIEDRHGTPVSAAGFLRPYELEDSGIMAASEAILELLPERRRRSPWLRDAEAGDGEAIAELILGEDKNKWNNLPPAEIHEHVAEIGGKISAVVAQDKGKIVGVVTFETGELYPEYQPKGREECEHGYLAEAVVHGDYRGQGIGQKLLKLAIDRLSAQGIREIYAKRDAGNAASGRMMEACEMEFVESFPDPIRKNGSGRTAVTQLIIED